MESFDFIYSGQFISESHKEHELAKGLLQNFDIYGYQWAIRIYLENMYAYVFQILDNESQDPRKGLLKTFDVFIGNAIEVTSNLHRPELLDDTFKATHS